MSDIQNWRNSFRTMLTSMQSHDAAGKRNRDQMISDSVKSFLATRPGVWLCFSGGDLEPLIDFKNVENVHFAFPILDLEKTQYVYYFSTSQTAKLKSSDYFEYEPDLSDLTWKQVSFDPKSTPGVRGAFVPGLGFDRHLYRLGRGSRFYERILSGKDIMKVGICYSEQLVEVVPGDDEDLQVDVIITDQEIYKK